MRRKPVSVAKFDNTAPKLSSLAPAYSFETHSVYFTILARAIETQPTARNIALAGTYGTGKSSILHQVAHSYQNRVVELSLLTLGDQPDSSPVANGIPPQAESTTNRIQKEIVKQLLYQQRPSAAPESRFRRIGRLRWKVELAVASMAGGVAALAAILLGLDITLAPTLALTVSGRPHWVAYVGMLLVVALVAGLGAFVVRALTRGRIGVEKISAGPATITLPPRSASYFDEYLDEIIYFFENNAKRDIVIIEDLDRFDEPQIFESLRSLNGLLNAAEQLNSRNIRFIYAMRDSVFEKLGQQASTSMTDEARAELVRSNRTKFFELVIPVVPFITHKNAADLMAIELESRDLDVSKDLIDLAARHLADMRLIHNIVNEYVVFKHRLLDVKTPVPGLDEDRLFAMMLFKNAHMGQFEKIRHATSSLDDLWALWRELVEANSTSIRLQNRGLRTQIANKSSGTRYATEVAQLLTSRIDSLFRAPGTGLASAALSYGGANGTADGLVDSVGL